MDIATIGLQVESNGVVTAIDRLDDFTAAGARAETVADSLGKQATQTSGKLKEVGAGADAAAKAIERTGASTRTAATAGAAFIKSLNDQIALYGASESEALRYKAAQLGVAKTSYEPLIQQLQNLRATEEAANAAARESIAVQSAIKASLQSADAARYQLIEGLREQIALYGLSGTEIAQYQAKLLGVSSSVDPLVAELKQLEAAQAQVNREQQKATANAGFLASLKDQAETYGLTTSEVLEYRAAQQGVSREAAGYIKKIKEQEAALNGLNGATKRGQASLNDYGLSAGQQKAALRLLPAQITDIVTSLISGQPAYLVAIQQGGQLKDSFGGIVPAARALVGGISLLTVGLAGGAVALGALIYGLVQGQRESEQLARSIILTGGAAGVTSGQLGLMADAIDRVIGTRAQAAEALGVLVSTGRVGGENLEYFAQTAIEASRSLGVSVEEIAKNFADLAKDPVQASIKLNDSLNYLNATTLEQIRILKDAGNATDAAALAQKAYADSLQSRQGQVEDNIGNIAKSWRYVADLTKEAKDALLDYGRTQSDESRLAQLQSLRGSRPLGTVQGERGQRAVQATNDTEERQLQSRVDLLQSAAKYSAEIAVRNREGFAAQEANLKVSESLLSNQEKLAKAVATYNANIEKQRKAGLTVDPLKVEQDLQRLRASFADKTDKTSTLDARVGEVQRALDALIGSYSNAEAILEAQRAARKVSDEAYYAARVNFIGLETAAQVQALTQENDILNKEVAIGQKRIDNQNKVAENVAKIAMIQADAAAQTTILGIQQQQAADKVTLGFKQSAAAAQEYLDTLKRGYDRQVDDFGKGPAARRYSAGRNQIDDQAISQRSQLESQRTSGQINEDQYQTQLSAIADFQQRAYAEWDAGYARIEARREDFSSGFNDALETYADGIKNLGATFGTDLIGALDQTISRGADFAASAALWGEGGSEAVKQLGRDLITSVVSSLIKVGLQYVTLQALQLAGIGTTTTAASAAAGALATIWSPAAVAASIATLGGASAVGTSAYIAALATGVAASTATSAATGGGAIAGAFADGGVVRGPGSGTSDSILAKVSNGEYVIKAAAVSNFGTNFFDSINAGRMPAFETGGFVGNLPVLPSPARMDSIAIGGQGGIQVAIYNSQSQNVNARVENERGPDGSEMLKVFIEAAEDPGSQVSRTLARRSGVRNGGLIG